MLSSSHRQAAGRRCSRTGCDEQSLYRPVFVFIFRNGARRGAVRPDVALCESHRVDLTERFRSPAWQLQFDQNLPASCATVDWSRSRVLFETTMDSLVTT